MTKFSKNQVLASLFWKLMERGGTQLIQFFVHIILARLLMPDDYGLITLVTVFITIATIFIESGFNVALIQKKDADNLDFSSVFYFSLAFAGLLYLFLFFAAPWIASYYETPQITVILRILAINLVFGAINSVQNAVVARELQFKLLFLRSTIALFLSGALGITMAYLNYGVWSLVGQSLSFQFLMTVILWFSLRWRPILKFSYDRLKSLFAFSWKILVGSLFNSAYRELRNLIVGKLYDPATLGYYNRGQQFPNLLVSNIDGSIQAVMFPVLSSHQDDPNRVKNMMRRSIMTGAFIVFPLMTGLAVTADSIVLLLLTDKWMPAVPFIQIFCLNYAFHPIQSANLEAVKGLGYSGTYLRLNIIKRTIGISVLLITVPFGVHMIALGQAISSLLASFINAYPNRKLLDYKYSEQIIDVSPSFALSLVMGALIYTAKWIPASPVFILAIQIFSGIAIYIGLAWILRIKSFTYLIMSMKDLFLKKRATP